MTATSSRPRDAGDDRTSGPDESPVGDPDERGQVAQAARGSALNLVGAVGAAIISFVTVGLITNHFGDAGAGIFFAATALFTLAANGARLGGESSLTFFVSRLRAEDRHGAITAVVTTAVSASALASGALAVVGVVTAPQLAALLADDPRRIESLTSMIRWLAFATPAFAVSQTLFGASRGFGTMRPSVIAGQLVRPLAQLSLVATVIVLALDITDLATAWALAALLGLLPITMWVRRRLLRIDKPPTGFQARAYWRFAAPRALTDLLSSALERSDLLLVAFFLGEAQAGLYGTANRLIVAGQLLMFATAQAMAPHLSANFGRGRNRAAGKVLQTVSAWNVTLLWPVFITMAFGASAVLALFGEEFTGGARLVQIFALSMVVVVGLGVGDLLLLMTGQSVASMVNHALALGTMVGLSAILLPRVGVVGAAWAWAVSRLVIRLLAVAQVWRSSRVHGLGPPVLTAGLIALVAYVPTGWMAHATIDSGLVAVSTHVLAGGLIQSVLCLVFRQRLELDQLVAIVSRGTVVPAGGSGR